jgi:hypothetical protein
LGKNGSIEKWNNGKIKVGYGRIAGDWQLVAFELKAKWFHCFIVEIRNSLKKRFLISSATSKEAEKRF